MEQIQVLLDALEKDSLLVAKICLATGSRWSEAEGLRISQAREGQIHFTGTKSGKIRSVPVDESLIEELKEHLKRDTEAAKGLQSVFLCPAMRGFPLGG